jgi:hypothetical protein
MKSYSQFQRSFVSIVGAVLLASSFVAAATAPAAAHDMPVASA